MAEPWGSRIQQTSRRLSRTSPAYNERPGANPAATEGSSDPAKSAHGVAKALRRRISGDRCSAPEAQWNSRCSQKLLPIASAIGSASLPVGVLAGFFGGD